MTPNITEDETTIKLNNKYCEAIWRSGGIPIIITYEPMIVESILDITQGLLLTGGGDIDPLLFGKQPLRELGEICPIRDKIELDLCKIALKRNIAVLGICRGCQILTIASGGSIYQDIYSQHTTNIKHYQQAPRYYPTHTVELELNSKIISIYNKNTIEVNSFHHQAVSSVGNEMIISARSKDNIIEAIEHKNHKFALGVQWHPEAMFEKYSGHLELFKQLILNSN